MARLARLVIPGLPHHITQRGNGRQRVFFSDDDYALYRNLLAENCKAAGVACWAFCLMPNHIHAILVPSDEDGLLAALAATHRRYAGLINARRKRTGHFWQGRYGAAVLDEPHLEAAFRYILINPVKAKLVAQPQDWRWSSAPAYLKSRDDGLTTTAPMRSRIPSMKTFLGNDGIELEEHMISPNETIGRPRGDEAFIRKLEKATGRELRARKRGPKATVKKASRKVKKVS
jgi:putative transposase